MAQDQKANGRPHGSFGHNSGSAQSEPDERQARQEQLASEIDAFVEGKRLKLVSAIDLASMNHKAQRIVLLRKAELLSLHRLYRLASRPSILSGVVSLIAIFSDNDKNGLCSLSIERFAAVLCCSVRAVTAALDAADKFGLIEKDEARGFSNQYLLTIPQALADPSVSIFDVLDVIAPRKTEPKLRGRRRDDARFASTGHEAEEGVCEGDTPEATFQGVNDSPEATFHPVVDTPEATRTTPLNVASPYTSTVHFSVEEEADRRPSAGASTTDLTSTAHVFLGATTNVATTTCHKTGQYNPPPYPPPADVTATLTAPKVAPTTSKRASEPLRGEVLPPQQPAAQVQITDDMVEALGNIMTWVQPATRMCDADGNWLRQPYPDAMAKAQLAGLLMVGAGSPPDICMQALREALSVMQAKLWEVEAVSLRGEEVSRSDIVARRMPYLSTVFKSRLTKIPKERHEAELAKSNATIAAEAKALADTTIQGKRIEAYGAAIERNASAKQIANAGAVSGGRSSRGSASTSRGMTIHKARIEPRDVVAIQASFQDATEEDAIDALRQVEEHNAPKKNDKGFDIESLSVNDVIRLAKGYLRAIVLHRMHGKPEKFVTGPVATVLREVVVGRRSAFDLGIVRKEPILLANQFVAVGKQWLDSVLEKLTDLKEVTVGEALCEVGIAEDVLQASKARSANSHVEAAFLIASTLVESQLNNYGPELTQFVETFMQGYLERTNAHGLAKREAKAAAAVEFAKSRTAQAFQGGYVPPMGKQNPHPLRRPTDGI